jgi:hypothetical protein
MKTGKYKIVVCIFFLIMALTLIYGILRSEGEENVEMANNTVHAIERLDVKPEGIQKDVYDSVLQKK